MHLGQMANSRVSKDRVLADVEPSELLGHEPGSLQQLHDVHAQDRRGHQAARRQNRKAAADLVRNFEYAFTAQSHGDAPQFAAEARDGDHKAPQQARIPTATLAQSRKEMPERERGFERAAALAHYHDSPSERRVFGRFTPQEFKQV